VKKIPQQVDVWVVVPPRLLLLDVAGPMEVLRRANLEQDAVTFAVHYVSPTADVTSSIGLPLSGLAVLPREVPENALIVIPGTADNVAFATDTPDERVRKHEATIVAWLKQTVTATHTLVSICSGALLAARAGMLDGHACTTSE
jgi:transcriptional regulator GlxA family with amidase domain